MKRSLSFLVLVPLAFGLLGSGCKSTHSDQWNSKFANPTMDTKQLTPDIEVGKHIHGRGKRSVLFGFIAWGDSSFAENAGANGSTIWSSEAAKAKKAAAYDALSQGRADILIGPQFTVTEKNYFVFKRYRAEAMGFAGTFKNVRQVKEFSTDQTETLPLPVEKVSSGHSK